MNQLQELLGELGLGDDSPPRDTGPEVATTEQATAFLAGVEGFKVGDIVVWREGMKCTGTPAYGERCVVTQKLSEPVRLQKSSVTAAEQLDIGLGFMHTISSDDEDDGKQVFADVLFDSRRFTKVGSINDN